MLDDVSITFGGTGEILGLPLTPSATGATSKEYVQGLITSGATGDGVLSETIWSNNTGGVGSPPIVITDTTLELRVTYPSPTAPTTFVLEGISRTGHTHDAIDIPIDNAFDVLYGTNTQTAIEQAASEIELLKTGGITPSATITVQRIFDVLAAPIATGSPVSPFEVNEHFADDNRVFLSVNGIKQYTHARASQAINYSSIISDAAPTGLSPIQTYEFDIAIDGGTAINAALTNATFRIAGFTEIFETTSSGTGSLIAITDPGGSPNLYLFAAGSPPSLTNFISVSAAVAGIEGDYMETDFSGNSISQNTITSHVVFNYDILTGSTIESLLYV